MTSHTGRLYALALGLVVFFLAWATVATHPWASTSTDPRLQALAAREAQLRQEAKLVKQIVAQRWATYRAELKVRQGRIAAARSQNTALASASSGAAAASSAVRVVNLPPLTITRTS